MSKKVSTVTTPAVIANAMNYPIANARKNPITDPDVVLEAHLDDEVLTELKAQTEPVKAQASAPAEADEAKAPTAPKAALKYDLPAILAALPDPITPAILDKGFGLNDGGKTVRRHLRNHFAEKMAHNKKDKWEFDKSTSTDIIEYFASRYTFHADAINTAKEKGLTAFDAADATPKEEDLTAFDAAADAINTAKEEVKA